MSRTGRLLSFVTRGGADHNGYKIARRKHFHSFIHRLVFFHNFGNSVSRHRVPAATRPPRARRAARSAHHQVVCACIASYLVHNRIFRASSAPLFAHSWYSPPSCPIRFLLRATLRPRLNVAFAAPPGSSSTTTLTCCRETCARARSPAPWWPPQSAPASPGGPSGHV